MQRCLVDWRQPFITGQHLLGALVSHLDYPVGPANMALASEVMFQSLLYALLQYALTIKQTLFPKSDNQSFYSHLFATQC